MNDDELIESVKAICSPTPECRDLRDDVVAELERRGAIVDRLGLLLDQAKTPAEYERILPWLDMELGRKVD